MAGLTVRMNVWIFRSEISKSSSKEEGVGSMSDASSTVRLKSCKVNMFQACRGELNLVITELYNYQFSATLKVGTEDKTK